VVEQNTVLDKQLVREMFRLMRPDAAETALHGIEIPAQYAKVLIMRKAKGVRE
jgi:hypothetical protein